MDDTSSTLRSHGGDIALNFLATPFRKVLNLFGIQVMGLSTYKSLMKQADRNNKAVRESKKVNKLQARFATPLLVQQIELGEFCLENISANSKAVVFARGTESLTAATVLGNKLKVNVVCDVLEVLDYNQRVAHRNAPDSVRLMVESAQAKMLTRCDHVLTVSNSVSKCLAKIGVKSGIMNQWHVGNTYQEMPEITEILKGKENVIVINCLQNEIGPLESALEGFATADLKNSICLIAGRVNPPHFEEHIKKLISEPRFGDRVHILGLLDANSYGTVLAHANAGLVTLDPKIGNHNASFPNRVVDYAAFGVPICTPALPDIMAEQKLTGYLSLVDDVRNPNDWSNAIKQALKTPKTKLKPILAARNWAKSFLKTLGNADEVFLIDSSWGWHGNRIKRQIMAILEDGRSVTYISRHFVLKENGRRHRNDDAPYNVEHFKTIEDLAKRPAWTE